MVHLLVRYHLLVRLRRLFEILLYREVVDHGVEAAAEDQGRRRVLLEQFVGFDSLEGRVVDEQVVRGDVGSELVARLAVPLLLMRLHFAVVHELNAVIGRHFRHGLRHWPDFFQHLRVLQPEVRDR